ncbi:hypothetical protein [Mesorhizobium sangaii]|uniref:Uncharacterized protein n=1 Tax=Mesorhizobium sangaii TaxID=505389 RepID=A0A841PH12_9HYPH|nr:hypothetical protein [Mesorhizobium sangaii]MBB6414436.1 hypothetical protein [Mesorhizobium sangaii]
MAGRDDTFDIVGAGAGRSFVRRIACAASLAQSELKVRLLTAVTGKAGESGYSIDSPVGLPNSTMRACMALKIK